MKKSENLKFEVETVKISVMLAIDALLRNNNDELLLEDNRGSLVNSVIDDQESEVIHRIWRKYHDHKAVIVAGVGVYEEDRVIPLEEYGIEFLINILEAAEEADEKGEVDFN
jgi:hypothetical protein